MQQESGTLSSEGSGMEVEVDEDEDDDDIIDDDDDDDDDIESKDRSHSLNDSDNDFQGFLLLYSYVEFIPFIVKLEGSVLIYSLWDFYHLDPVIKISQYSIVET